MMVVAFASVIFAWGLGTLIVVALRPCDDDGRGAGNFLLPLGALVGLGVTSVIFLASSLLVSRPAFLAGALEMALMAWLAWIVGRRSPAKVSTAPVQFSWMHGLFVSLFVQCLLVAVVIAWRAFQAAPFGGWDGWAIWNMHARFLVRGGTEWPALLAAPQLSWTHPDYPPLVAASVARVWAWTGAEPPMAGGLISVTFAAALLALLMAVIGRSRGNLAAFAGGLLLVGTPFFVTFSSNQHADIPFAGYILAAVACVMPRETVPVGRGGFALAGLCVGLAAWTKNEGLLFALTFGAIVTLREWRRGSRGALRVFFGALVLGLLPVIGFKLLLAPSNDLVAPALGPRLVAVFDLTRHATILKSLWRDLREFGEWQVLPYFAMVLTLPARRRRSVASDGHAFVIVVIGLMLAGYYGVYLISPHDLAWHLDTSLVRLLLQLWPLAILWWCLALPSDAELPGRRPSGRVWPMALIAVNVIAAASVLLFLSSQPAANELATRRIGFALVSVGVGEGWFAPERHGQQRWVWSQGDAVLRMHSDASQPTAPMTFRFSLRSLAPRRVTVRMDDRVIWEGPVAENYVPVELKNLSVPPGTTTLRFSTDVPGRPESAAPGARALAFATYDPSFR